MPRGIVVAVALTALLGACSPGPDLVLAPASGDESTVRTFAIEVPMGDYCRFPYSSQVLEIEPGTGSVLRSTGVPWTWRQRLLFDGDRLLSVGFDRASPFALGLHGAPHW